MKEILISLLAFSVCSNVWLWINLWNLKNELFDFEKRILDYLAILSKQITADHAKDATNDAAPKV